MNANDPFSSLRKPAQPGQAVVDPANWDSAELLKNEQRWLYELSDTQINQVIDAVRAIDAPSVDPLNLTRDHFSLTTLETAFSQIRNELAYGIGVALIRGLPVEQLGKRGTALAFWGISQHLGDGVFSQNKHGHVLGHVTNLGQSKSNPNQRGPYSNESIPYHVDCADTVGLLCLESAVSGGESSIASAVTVHNCMLNERPDLVDVLCKPYFRDRRDEIPPGMLPWYEIAVFHFFQGYFSATIEPTYMSSPHRFDGIPEMSALQKEAIDYAQHVAQRECLDMQFQQGDMQYLNNHVMFHSRRGFEDAQDPEKRRHLLRIWLKRLDGRPLPEAFYLRHGKANEVDRPGGIVGPNTTLSAPLMRT